MRSGILLSGFLFEILVERRNLANLRGQRQTLLSAYGVHDLHNFTCFTTFPSFIKVSSSLTGLVCSCPRRGLKQLLSINVTLEKHYAEQPFVDFRCGPGEAEDFIICVPGDVSYRRP